MREIMSVCGFLFYISLDITGVKVQCGIQMKGQVINQTIVVAQWSDHHLSRVIFAKEMQNASIGTHTFLVYAD